MQKVIIRTGLMISIINNQTPCMSDTATEKPPV